MKKLLEWVYQHVPFQETSNLISVTSGVVGYERINCHMAQEVGITSISRIINSGFQSVKFRRNERMQPLAVMSSAVKVGEVKIPINPTTLFQRITITKQSDQEQEKYLTYELSPYPMSLFEEFGMRKTSKSSLYKALTSLQLDIPFESCVYVIDGGYLLHRVVWQTDQTFG
jgi:hypothetical protein